MLLLSLSLHSESVGLEITTVIHEKHLKVYNVTISLVLNKDPPYNPKSINKT